MALRRDELVALLPELRIMLKGKFSGFFRRCETSPTICCWAGMGQDHDNVHVGLDRLIELQAREIQAGERARFHALDDQFHHDICTFAGLEFVWTLVKDNKGHMDRARYLSLSYGAETAFAEHRRILDSLRRRDAEAAVTAIRQHLSRIEGIIARLRVDQPQVFG